LEEGMTEKAEKAEEKGKTGNTGEAETGAVTSLDQVPIKSRCTAPVGSTVPYDT
jgi:hypothetical protein